MQVMDIVTRLVSLQPNFGCLDKCRIEKLAVTALVAGFV